VPSFAVSPASPVAVSADLVLLPFHEGRVAGPGVPEVQEALGGDLMAVLKEHRVTGKVGDSFTLPTFGRLKAGSVMLVGLGPKEEAGSTAVRKAALKVSGRLAKFATVATTLHQVGDDPGESAHALAEGVTLGAYRFDRYKERPIDEASREPRRLKRVLVLGGDDRKASRAGLKRGSVYAEAANWARDLVNTPALDATPEYLAGQAKEMAKAVGLTCKVWTKAELARGGFGGILGVGRGSANEPRFVELTYRGAGDSQPIAITGKGITFDSGGLSLKQPEWMETMKDDMSGGAATLAAMRAIAELKPKVNVVAAIPFAENMPGGSAIRPGDVLRHRGGKTSEVLNTDAEGRLVLADALAFLAEKKPRVIIDSATLTGAAMIALGYDLWAVMGTDQGLVEDLLAAGRAEGEPGWELPLWEGYRRSIESTIADVRNVATTRYGGAINAGLFLREFVGDVPWAHMDVAGTAFIDTSHEFWPKGATGCPARTLIRYVEEQAARGDGASRRARA